MPYFQLGFARTRTETDASGNYVLRHNLRGRYLVRIIGYTSQGVNQSSPNNNDWISRINYLWSDQFYLSNDVGNINDVSAKYLRFTNTDDQQMMFAPIITTMDFQDSPILLNPVNLYNSASNFVNALMIHTEIMSLDNLQLSKQPVELPLLCRLAITNGPALTASNDVVYRFRVNANGRYRARFLGYTMTFGTGAVGAATANGNTIIQLYSSALNNFGANGGDDGGLALNKRNYRCDHFKTRNYPYFVTNDINGVIDIRPTCKLTTASVNEITWLDLYLELMPIKDLHIV
jgi:hypothetical protein